MQSSSLVSRVATGTFALLTVTACSDGSGPTAPDAGTSTTGIVPHLSATFDIGPAADTITVGDSLQLRAVWQESSGTFVDTNATWTSSNANVATVTAKGLARGVSAGNATIVGQSYNRADTLRLVVVAPPAPTPTPTPGTTPAHCPTSLCVIGDDFTTYAGTAGFMSNVGVGKLYNDGSNQSLASIDPTVTFGGHQTLKYSMPAGTSSVPQLWPSLPRLLSNVWFHAVVRFSPGFTTAGSSGSGVANSYKFMGLGFGNTYGTARMEFTHGGSYQLYAATVNGSLQLQFASGGGITTEWSDGAWYDYYMHYQVMSPSQVRIRFFRARYGQTPVLVATTTPTVAAGYPAPTIGFMQLGLNFNQVRTQAQALWYGLWEAVDGAARPNPYNIPGA